LPPTGKWLLRRDRSTHLNTAPGTASTCDRKSSLSKENLKTLKLGVRAALEEIEWRHHKLAFVFPSLLIKGSFVAAIK